ncbi:agglutinin biogenesis protein MshI [Methylobacillus flagellatus]|uniref:agglutinin biogenesis protein MshI n=1 Tax=Methylobacillus flagellatus TaxID=405 RepID=UPI0010F8FF9B|nr:agglutinin biogenesis protein MshI [Methylobacillus flagellatus]
MRLFKNKKKQGWLAVVPVSDGVCVARLEPAADKPRIVLSEYRRWLPNEKSGLKSLAVEFGFNHYHCVSLLQANEYQLLQVEAPRVPADEVRQAVRWRLKDLIDYPMDQATLDVLTLPGEAGNRTNYLYVAVAKNDIIRERMARFIDQSNIALEVIDIAETAQRNLSSRLEQPGRGLAMLSFGLNGGLLTVTQNGELYHARQFDISLRQLQQEQQAELRQSLYERVALELQRSLDNFERQFPNVGIAQLVIAPYTGRDTLVNYLRDALYLPVAGYELHDIFDTSLLPSTQLDIEPALLLALGAALREEASA